MGLAGAARRIRPSSCSRVVLPLLVALLRLDSLHDRFETAGLRLPRARSGSLPGRLLDGGGPVPKRHGHGPSLASGNPSVYPPLPIVLATPVARLGFDAAFVMLDRSCSSRPSSLRSGWSVSAIGAAIRWPWVPPPVVEGLFFGNITLSCSCCRLRSAWRWRAHGRSRPGSPLRWAVAVEPVVLSPLSAWLLLDPPFPRCLPGRADRGSRIGPPRPGRRSGSTGSARTRACSIASTRSTGREPNAPPTGALMARLERRPARPPWDLPRSGVAAPRARVPVLRTRAER